MSTQYACPSPTGRNNAQLFLTKSGTLVDRHGRAWGKSSIRRMAMDALPPDLHGAAGAGEKSDHEHKEMALRSELQRLLDEYDMHDEVAAAVMALVDKFFPPSEHNRSGPGPNAVRGKGARDGPLSRHRAPGGDADEPNLEAIAKFLAGKGLSPAEVAEAIEIVKRDHEEARDARPENAINGGFGGRFSGANKGAPSGKYPGLQPVMDADLAKEFPGIDYTAADPYGEPVSQRLEREAATVRERGGRLAGDTAPCFDAELQTLIDNVKTTMFG
jgi:hypothetical protein